MVRGFVAGYKTPSGVLRLRRAAGLGLRPGDGRLGVGFPLGLRKHDIGLLAGGAVHEVVAEEDLGSRSAGGSVLGHIIRADVDRSGVGFLDHLDGHCFVVGARNAVGQTLSCLDDQVNAAVVCKRLIQLEGEGLALADDGRGGRGLNTHERGRVDESGAAAGDDPVVQAGEQVGAGDLGLGANDTTAFLTESQLVLGKDLGVREALPLCGELLENALDLGLVCSADGAAVTAVADVFAALHLCGRNALGAAAHLLEGDG